MLTRRQLFQATATLAVAQTVRAQPVDLERRLALPPPGRLQVVLDTDTFNEIDDQYAVAYSLLSPDRMEVKAIYAAPFVNALSPTAAVGMEQSYKEILRLLAFFPDIDERIVLRGSDRYFESVHRPIDSPAARDLINKAMNSGDEPLYVLTIGSPVNVSSAILMEPRIKERIVVVWLGGTTHYWPSAREFNLQQDVIASQVLFDSGVPLVQITTKNVSEHLRTTVPELTEQLQGRSLLGDYLHGQFLQYYARAMNRGRRTDTYPWSKVIWDISAIAWLINPEWVPSEIVDSPVLTDDMRWESDTGRHSIRVANNVFRDAVFHDLFEKLATL